MNDRENITAAYVRAILDYNENTGVFRWKYREPDTFPNETTKRAISIWNARFPGTIAGTLSKGRITISVRGRLYFAHRLAMLIAFGKWPEHEVDHINGVPSDNRLCNLREATSEQNQQNTKKRLTNTSGYTGVVWCKQQKQWKSRIQFKRKFYHLGRFASKEAAYEAYLKAKAQLHTFQPMPREEHGKKTA